MRYASEIEGTNVLSLLVSATSVRFIITVLCPDKALKETWYIGVSEGAIPTAMYTSIGPELSELTNVIRLPRVSALAKA